MGRRAKKTFTDITDSSKNYTTLFYNDGGNSLAELDSNKNIELVYTNIPNGLDGVLTADIKSSNRGTLGEYFLLKDQVGSITGIVNSSGSLVQRNIYSAYGQLIDMKDGGNQSIASPVVNINKFYTARDFDKDIGLQFNRARFYDPTIGRFTQTNPASGNVSNPYTYLSKYIYGLNNPNLYIDPTGEAACGGVCATIIAITLSIIFEGLDSPEPNDFSQDGAVGLYANFNTDGSFGHVSATASYNSAHLYYNFADGYEEYVAALENDMGISESYLLEGVLLSSTKVVRNTTVWARRYPRAGGGGVGLDYKDTNIIRFDWHKLKVKKGIPGTPNPTYNRPHIDSDKFKIKHWPWQ